MRSFVFTALLAVCHAQEPSKVAGLSATTLLPYGLPPGLMTSIPHDTCGTVLAAQADDLEVFSLGIDRAIWHKRRAGGAWGVWKSIGGVASSGPAVVKDDESRLHVFIRGVDRAVWHSHQLNAADGLGKWSNWARLGNFSTSSGPALVVTAEGLIDVFALGADKAVWHIGQVGVHEDDHTLTVGKCPTNTKQVEKDDDSAAAFVECASTRGEATEAASVKDAKEDGDDAGMQSASTPLTHPRKNKVIWSEWESLGGIWTSKPSVNLSPEGLLGVFVRGVDRSIYHKFQVATEKKGVQWSEWHNLKGVFASAPKITVVQNAEGLTNVYARGIDRQYYVRAQKGSKLDGISWAGWQSLGGIWAGGPVLVQNSDDHLELFGRGTDLSIWHKTAEKTTDNDCKWGKPESLGGRFAAAPSVVVNTDGFMEVFARGFDQAIWHKKQREVNGTISWSTWSTLGGALKGFPC